MSHVSQPLPQHHKMTGGGARYWLGLTGGGGAWFAHLLFSYLAAEFGCASALASHRLLEINAVAWLVLALTLLTAAVALGAAALAYRSWPPQPGGEGEPSDATAQEYAARAGLIADGAFACVILVEGVPVFYYLQACS